MHLKILHEKSLFYDFTFISNIVFCYSLNIALQPARLTPDMLVMLILKQH